MLRDVTCFGEALVDLLPEAKGQRVRDVESWRRCVGGAPANVAVGVARLGGKSALNGVTGDDEFGHFLKESLQREGVDVSHLRQTTQGKTGLAFISLTASGERSFSFYRQQSAETFLEARDVDPQFLESTRVLHLGTNSLLVEAARESALEATRLVERAGRIVSFDPNLRLHLWKEPEVLRGLLRALLPRLAVLKLSEEEFPFVTPEATPEAALAWLAAQGVALPIVTLAERGALLRWQGALHAIPAPRVPVVDTTGAGDGFMAGLLYALTRSLSSRAQLLEASAQTVIAAARVGCEVGSKVVQKLGAVAGLPRAAEVAHAL